MTSQRVKDATDTAGEWNAVFWHHVRKGEDRSSAAFAADQWQKRQNPRRWADCPSTHCERTQECRSPHECSAMSAPAAPSDNKPERSIADETGGGR